MTFQGQVVYKTVAYKKRKCSSRETNLETVKIIQRILIILLLFLISYRFVFDQLLTMFFYHQKYESSIEYGSSRRMNYSNQWNENALNHLGRIRTCVGIRCTIFRCTVQFLLQMNQFSFHAILNPAVSIENSWKREKQVGFLD